MKQNHLNIHSLSQADTVSRSKQLPLSEYKEKRSLSRAEQKDLAYVLELSLPVLLEDIANQSQHSPAELRCVLLNRTTGSLY